MPTKSEMNAIKRDARIKNARKKKAEKAVNKKNYKQTTLCQS